MAERYCDALIIGTDISGLITASFLARRGLTVHVLDLNPFSGGGREPDPFCIAHLHSKLLRSILGRLNIPETDIQYLSNHDSTLQIIFPDKRIDVASDPTVFYEEILREFPNEHEQIKTFYESLSRIKQEVEPHELYSLLLPTSFSERRLLSKFIKSRGLERRLKDVGLLLDSNSALKKFILSQYKLVAQTHLEEPFAFQIAELLNPNEGEILSIQGGHQYLKNLFLDRLVHHEGVYRPESTLEEILFKNGVVVGAKLAGFEGTLLARHVIWNTLLKRLPEFLPNLWRFRSLRKAIERLHPTHYWFGAHFEVPVHFIPAPMKDNLLFLSDPNKDLLGENFLYIQIKRPKKDEEICKISVNYLLPEDQINQPPAYFENLHKNIHQKLHFLIPFAGEYLQNTFPNFAPPVQEDTLFPLKENDFEIFKKAASAHPIYTQQPKSFSDLFPLTYKTPAPNFYLTAPEILGSLGYEGKFMLGLKVTDLIWQDVEKEKKRAMKLEKRIA